MHLVASHWRWVRLVLITAFAALSPCHGTTAALSILKYPELTPHLYAGE